MCIRDSCIRYAKNIVSLGTASFIMQLTNSLVSICCNNVLADTGGDLYVSVMTIISSVRQMVDTPIFAITEGSSPIISYNYGARRPDRCLLYTSSFPPFCNRTALYRRGRCPTSKRWFSGPHLMCCRSVLHIPLSVLF